MRNKDLAYDIARTCKLPINEARKILFVLLDAMVRDIRKNTKLKVKGFGDWKIFVQKRVRLPDGSYVQQTKNKCRFVLRGKLRKLLYSSWWDPLAWTLANKFARLTREGNKKYAKIIKKRLRDRIAHNRD